MCLRHYFFPLDAEVPEHPSPPGGPAEPYLSLIPPLDETLKIWSPVKQTKQRTQSVYPQVDMTIHLLSL